VEVNCCWSQEQEMEADGDAGNETTKHVVFGDEHELRGRSPHCSTERSS
jgi:hypothetical protein